MMSPGLTAVAALLPSLLLLSLLAWRDPKRLRSLPRSSASQRASAWTQRRRRIVTALSLLPGALLIATGAWPALLIWLGALLSCGWLWVMWLAPPAVEPH